MKGWLFSCWGCLSPGKDLEGLSSQMQQSSGVWKAQTLWEHLSRGAHTASSILVPVLWWCWGSCPEDAKNQGASPCAGLGARGHSCPCGARERMLVWQLEAAALHSWNFGMGLLPQQQPACSLPPHSCNEISLCMSCWKDFCDNQV